MRIAFLSADAYHMLTGDGTGTVGGAQLQQVLIGRELAARGHEVVFLEKDQNETEPGRIDGVDVVTYPTRSRGGPFGRAAVRFLDVLSTLRAVNPDVCYGRVPRFELLAVATYCSVTGARFVYGFAHDSELTDDPVAFDSALTDNRVYRRLIHLVTASADVLVAQNDFQASAAASRYDVPVVKIPNCYPLPDGEAATDPMDDQRPTVVWVSTLRPWKQPELVLEVARAVEEAVFVIVGGKDPAHPSTAEAVASGAADLDNVRYEGFVPHDRIHGYYAAADVFLNTSELEGFPNTFLEAWAHATPVASLTVDPSGLLSERGLGLCADGDLATLVESVRTLVADESLRTEVGERARRYHERHHSVGSVVDRFERVIAGDVDGAR